MYYPEFNEFKKLATKGNLIPVYREIYGDIETPVSAFSKINDNKYSFLFESIEGGEKWARFSFLGSSPKLIFRSKGKLAEIIKDGQVRKCTFKNDPLDIVKEILSEFKPVKVSGLPRFTGGAVGFIGYDFVRFFEKIGDHSKDVLSVYDAIFMLMDTIVVFDNLSHKIKVVANAYVKNLSDASKAYQDAKKKIERIIKKLRSGKIDKRKKRRMISQIKPVSNMKKEVFEEIVRRAKKYIRAGDIIQVVLSQRLSCTFKGNPFNVYRALRVINPSPYMYYLKLGDIALVGSSPEILVRVERGNIELRPIAGTRRRGKDEKEDRKLEKELLSDPKECAEHIMLVDLGRNDVGRVAKKSTVEVNELMTIERYSHVMHIVSNVRGKLKKNKDVFDVIRACFPAGTVSGAPKVRAMEIIEELESEKRGPYAGAVGYFSFSGNMDTCITIRTLLFKDNKVYVQGGAGIVADSVPEREYTETMNKMKAMFEALKVSSEFDYE
ncbi:MAG: anthranilate synthase component I [Candidatus Schekmanbacteria bacterium]|nr:MAG: anthranilate synthase component I [Candidatus Schekmanbacteria bacterium]